MSLLAGPGLIRDDLAARRTELLLVRIDINTRQFTAGTCVLDLLSTSLTVAREKRGMPQGPLELTQTRSIDNIIDSHVPTGH